MTLSKNQARRTEGGFTLVELAIVMIIIGLLIGGILKGQELINNARVSSTVAQVKAFESGISGFRDKYAGMPGDILTPVTRIANCANWCATAGDADERIEIADNGVDVSVASGNADNEALRSFPQLAAAGFIGGVQPGANALGTNVTNPATSIGGAWQLAFGNTATGASAAAGLTAGHYAVAVTAMNVAGGAANAPFEPTQAAAIDRKLDDGMPNTGIVRALSALGATDGVTGNAATDTYREVVTGRVVGLAAKVQ